MKARTNTIHFTKTEIDVLRKHYKQELLKAEEKVAEIKLMLKNLQNLSHNAVQIIPVSQKQNTRNKVISNIGTSIKNGQSTGRNAGGQKPIKWTNIIIDTLQNKKTLLPSRAFVDIVVSKYKINEADVKRTRSNITGCLSDLTKKYKRLVRYGEYGGKKGLYGLAEWFDSKGRLQSSYKLKKG